MDKENLIKISEFSKMTGISRANLIYYDNIGLLTPYYRGENGYRYYSFHNLGKAFLIINLRYIGISIDSIKDYSDNRNPENMEKLFYRINKDIEQEIVRLRHIQESMKIYSEMVSDIDFSRIDEIQKLVLPEKPMFVQPDEVQYVNEDYQSAAMLFYDYAKAQGLNGYFPFGSIVMPDQLMDQAEKKWKFYFSVPKSLSNELRPSGTYLVGYQYGSYGQAASLYERLLSYIKANNLKICGNAYEEYPLNEVSTKNQEEFLICIMIQIK